MAEGSGDLVQRRLRFIERQQALRQAAPQDVAPGDVVPGDVGPGGAPPERQPVPQGTVPQGTGPVNRHGMPRLPVGQHEVRNWPVLDLGDMPEVATADWRLEIGGLVANPVTLTWDDFLALPQVDDVSDFHCVTTWSRFDNRWGGVRFRTLAELVVPNDDARFVLCTGHDRWPGTRIPYTTNLPLSRALEDDVLLVHTWEHAPLPREHGGPCRMITPKLYAWKGTKWIRRIDFLASNAPGFWETRGYSNSAEPWLDDRFSG